MKKIILFIVLAALCLNFRGHAQTGTPNPTNELKGKIVDEQGLPLPGATIKLQDVSSGTISDNDGVFILYTSVPAGTLTVTFVGYQTLRVPFTNPVKGLLTIQLKADASSLNEVQVIGYGTTTQRYNTGSVSTISATDIEKQPVTNVLSALSGKAPGVFVQTTNGLPGGGISIQIRGKGSIQSGTDPLYVIDGIPFNSSPLSANNAVGGTTVAGLVSPLNSLNPADIDDISILKDADATAIYGSRGANGVILITTKKGKAGKTQIDLNYAQGVETAATLPRLLSNQQYLQIRQQAFANDGLVPSADPTSPNYAPDLKVWDTNKSTDWARYMLGNTGHTSDFQGSVAGGNASTKFNIGGNFHSEESYLPGDNDYERGGIRYSIEHQSENKRFTINLNGSYTTDDNRLANPAALTNEILAPPDMPLYNSQGQLNWDYGLNPLADLLATSKIHTNNLVTNLTLKYAFTEKLNFSVNAGYNNIDINQVNTFPKASQNPQYVPASRSYFADNNNHTYIIEPTLTYNYTKGKSTMNFLAGGTYQNSLSQGQYIAASNFSSDQLLENLGSAGTVNTLSNSYIQYKYVSVFARATFNIADKYLFNASVRRDGSSRFGPGNQFGNFGAVGAGWLFSSESWLKSNLPFLSYGKLRASYGIVGNDQIPDYQYLSTYGSSGYVYQDTSGLKPTKIANADFKWEINKKLDAAVELGFIKDRILITVDHYQTRSANQLVAYAIPTITGFASYQANLPAVVENTGWEFEVHTKNIDNGTFKWQTSFNLTVPKNKLVSFYNFAASSYSKTLAIGEDITRITGYLLTGVNPTTGKAVYASQPGSASTSPYFYNDIGKKTPDSYGGFGNNFSYKNWQLFFFAQFAKQQMPGNIQSSPGLFGNNFAYVAGRWQHPGDITNIPAASTIDDFYYSSSSGNFFDASYIRLKTVSLSYEFPKTMANHLGIQRIRIYAEGQNMLTFWNRNVPLLDPESGYSGLAQYLPPMKTIVAGLQITL